MSGFVDNLTKQYCENNNWLNWGGLRCETQCDDCKRRVKLRRERTEEIIKNNYLTM